MNKLILSLLFFFLVNAHAVFGEAIPYKMHELFFESDLISEVKIVSHTDTYYTIRIRSVFRDNGFGLKKDDYIRIKKDFNITSSSEVISSSVITDEPSGIAFLVKTKNGWTMRKFFSSDEDEKTTTLYLAGCQITGSTTDLKTQIVAYFKEFSLDEKGMLVAQKKANEVKSTEHAALVLLQYYKLYPFTIDTSIVTQLDCFTMVAPIEE